MSAAPALAAAAVDRLPRRELGVELDADPFWRLVTVLSPRATAGRRTVHTRR
jgi:hypothetical protein